MILRRSWHSPPPQTRLGSNGDNEQFRSLTQFNLPRDGLFPESVQAIHLLSVRGPILRFENVPACPHPCCQQIPAASKFPLPAKNTAGSTKIEKETKTKLLWTHFVQFCYPILSQDEMLGMIRLSCPIPM